MGEFNTHISYMSSTPVVHDVDNSGHFELSCTKPSKPFLSLFVYVTPLMSNVCPTATPGHMTVTPLDAR